MTEEWKDVPGWEGMYKISNLGRCFSVRTGKIKPAAPNNYGYLRLACYDKERKQKFFVHRLVAKLFVDGWFDGAVVNHIDGNKQNNVCTNLEWCTKSYNELHAYKLGMQMKKKRNRASLFLPADGDPSQLTFETIVDCANYLGISPKRLHHLLKTKNGYIPEANGYLFVARLTTSPDECKGVGHKQMVLEMGGSKSN